MKNLENWSHSLPLLLKSGRCSHFVPSDLDDEVREEFLAKLNEQDNEGETALIMASQYGYKEIIQLRILNTF